MLAFANEQIQEPLPNGVKIVGIKGVIATHAPGAEVQLTFISARDVAGNLISPNPLTVTMKKGNKYGIAPTLSMCISNRTKYIPTTIF